MNEVKWYLRTQDETFGPESESRLIEWAKLGRIQPGQEISNDNTIWLRVEDVPFLDMRFSIDIGDGNPRGPFNKAAAEALLASGRLPMSASLVETRPPFEPESEPESEPTSEPEAELPPDPQVVEKIVEKEVRIEVPVEKIVEKIVVDETRVKELERLLNDATARETKLSEQVVVLEDELKRLPAAASEVADIQAAVFKIMQDEAASLAETLEREKVEFENYRKRHHEREERLTEYRREILKKSGKDLNEMTRRALVERPEDPRTACLRRDYEELQRVHEKSMLDSEAKIRQLTEQVQSIRAEGLRRNEDLRDVAQLRAEAERLREQLQAAERDLLNERQHSEELERREATSRQALMARVAALESPSIGTSSSLETNQSREAKMVKLPSWMRLKR